MHRWSFNEEMQRWFIVCEEYEKDFVVDNTVVSGNGGSDIGTNDVAGVDEGPGEPGVVDED